MIKSIVKVFKNLVLIIVVIRIGDVRNEKNERNLILEVDFVSKD